MRLAALLADADLRAAGVTVRGDTDSDVEVESLTLDSRAVAPGALYCSVVGQGADGHDFAMEAVSAGAVAVLAERRLDVPVPQVVVDRVRPALGPLADSLYGHPSRALTVVGVTGTNGKTTATHLLSAIFEAAGMATATVGTLSGPRTTPEAPLLQALLADLRRRGAAAVAMEVSSHALVQHRVDAVHFAAAVFTNLSHDHLDYHHTMEDYFAAKARLFDPDRAAAAVINADDAWGRRLLDQARRERPRDDVRRTVVPFSIRDVDHLEIGGAGSTFDWHGLAVRLTLGGRFNVSNALAAAATAEALGIDGSAIVEGLAAVASVRGRFEPIDAGQAFTVLVDYAHTPDGLEQALRSARELTSSDLVVVFGAGGDRDRAKRPAMGEVAARLADLVVLTSDNPRGEDPQAIIDEIRAGTHGASHVLAEPDRSRAIGTALAAAGPGDVVVIAGKGHETVQEIAGRAISFDDAVVAREAIERILRSRNPRDSE